jgi:ribonuclease HII
MKWQNTKKVIGIDEAGRGSLIGGVFVCALYFEGSLDFDVKDSKMLSTKRRLEIFNKLNLSSQVKFALDVATLEEVESLNVLNATLLAMERAYKKLGIKALVKIDGNKKPKNLDFAECVIGGDRLIPQISSASIIAKVMRDREMLKLDTLIPNYKIAKNKGYGTKEHFEAINKYGLSDFHRKSWNI